MPIIVKMQGASCFLAMETSTVPTEKVHVPVAQNVGLWELCCFLPTHISLPSVIITSSSLNVDLEVKNAI